jgi:Salmonella virulence plasmid 65kDa B protein/FG-GAP-like repeat
MFSENRLCATVRTAREVIAVGMFLGAAMNPLLAATVAGAIPGQFSVSPVGTANYQIPIQAPPGVAGVEPRLSVVYTGGGASTGLVGVGWEVSGLSAISRCARTVAQDGVRGSVKFDANDRFCLDGQRLMLVSGTYGQAGSEYRTELDNFSKIVSYGTAGSGVSHFKVWTKGGQILEYGNTADSKIEPVAATGTTAPWTSGTVREWALNRVADSRGNYLTVTYDEDATNGVYRPNRIDYTGNAGTGTSPNSSIRFTYEALPYTLFKYRAGAQMRHMSRVSEIAAYSGASTLVTKTTLTYEAVGPAQSSRLTSATVCDGASNCLPSLAFTYAAPTNTFAAAAAWPLPSGFGVQEQTYMSIPDGTDWYIRSVGFEDVNGDGLADFCVGGPGSMSCTLNSASGIGSGSYSTALPFSAWEPAHFKQMRSENGGVAYSGILDINGDGLPDYYKAYSGQFFLYLGTPTGISPTATPWAWPGGPAEYTYSEPGISVVIKSFRDMNGDGLPDLYVTSFDGNFSGNYTWYEGAVFFNTGSGFSGAVPWAIPAGAGSGGLHGPQESVTMIIPDGTEWYIKTQGLIDINGDGLPDFCQQYAPGSMRCGLNTGTKFLPLGDPITLPAQPWEAAHVKQIQSRNANLTYADFVDINGDGYPDYYKFLSGQIYIYLGNGSGFSSTPVTWSWPAGLGGPSHSIQDGHITNVFTSLRDMNGDGFPDIYSTTLNQYGVPVPANVYLNQAKPLAQLVQVSSSTTPTIGISYSKLTDAAVYTKDSGGTAATYPKIDLAAAHTVVSSVATSNGIGGTNTTNYKYGGLKMELGFGRGMLGFRWTSSKETTTNLENYTEYRQDFPYLGMPSKKETRLAGAGSGGVLKRTTVTTGCQIPLTLAACTVAAGNRYFPYVASSAELSWDLSGTALPSLTSTFTYGENPQYGNPTQINISNGDGSSKNVVNEYWPADTTNWILGRVKKTTVTSTKP